MEHQKSNSIKKIILIFLVVILIGIVIVLVPMVTGLDIFELIQNKAEIDLNNYSATQKEQLLEDFPYRLKKTKEGIISDYANPSEEIMVTLNMEKSEIETISITGHYPKLKVYGIHTGMSFHEAKNYAKKEDIIVYEGEAIFAIEPPNSTHLICVSNDLSGNSEKCEITIEFGETMSVSQKERDSMQYIRKVKAFKTSSMTKNYEQMFNMIDENRGKWSCSMALANVYSEGKKANVFYKTKDKEIIWAIDEKGAISLVSAIIENNELESNADLEEYLLEQVVQSVEEMVVGIWHNGETMWATNYHTIFYDDGTVQHVGYRNVDIGTYEMIADYTIKAVFDEYVQWAGEEYDYLGTYVAYYTYDLKTGDLERRIGERSYYSDANNDFDNRTLIKVEKMVEDSEYY